MAGLPMSANRRGSIVRRRRRSRLFIVPMAGLLVMASTASMAQDAGSAREQGRLMTVVPRLSLTETLTDNVRLSSADRQSEQITEISPGISVKFAGDRLKGFFDYALNQVVYANNSSPSRTQNALSAAASLEAIEDWAYIDFGGQISQQMVSAFGLQSIDNTSVNANRAEVSSYRISPYVRGRLGDMSSYEARYSRTVTGSDSAVMSDLTTEDGTLRFRGGSAFSEGGHVRILAGQRPSWRCA